MNFQYQISHFLRCCGQLFLSTAWLKLLGLIGSTLLVWAVSSSPSYAYSTKTPMLRIEIGQHTGMINRMAINQAGTLLATAADDKTLRLWNLPAGTAYATLRVPIGENLLGALYATALSPDGKTVLAAGETGNAQDKFSLYVFDVEKRVLKARIADLPSSIYHLAFSNDGRYFAGAFAGGVGIKVWASDTGAEVAQDHDYQERSTWLEFDASGNLVTVAHDGFLRLYDAQFALVKKVPVNKQDVPYSIKYNSDYSKIAVGYANAARVDIFNAQLGLEKSINITQLQAQNAAIVAWQGTQGLYVAGNMQNEQGEYVLRHWQDIAAEQDFHDVLVSKNIVTDVLSLTDASNTVDTLFATAEPSWGALKADKLVYKNQANLWDARVVELPQKTFHVSADGLKIAYALDANSEQFALFDVNKLSLETSTSAAALNEMLPAVTEHATLKVSQWQRGVPRVNNQLLPFDAFEHALALAIEPVTAHALIGSNYHLRLVDAKGQELKKINVPAEVYGLNITGNGQLAVAALGDGTIRWFSLRKDQVLQELAAFFPYNQGKAWIAWTKEGFFATSDAGGHQLAGYQINKGDNKRPEWLSYTQLYQGYYAPELLVPKLLGQDEAVQERLKTVPPVEIQLTNSPVPSINLVEYCTVPNDAATRAFTRAKPVAAEAPTAAPEEAAGFWAKVQAWFMPIKTWVIALLHLDDDKASAPVQPAIQVASAPVCYPLSGQGNTRAFTRQKPETTTTAIYRNQFEAMVPTIKLRYSVQAKEGGVGDVDVYVNNQIQQSQKEAVAAQAGSNVQEFTQELTLKPGENRIYVNAYEKSGGAAAQSTLVQLLNPESRGAVLQADAKPKMYIFSVGINAYPAPNQLEFAVKDASDFLNTVGQFKSDRYADVVKFGLMDADASLQNIEATFDKIGGLVNEQDTVLIYLSGHGLKEGNEYYFIPQDVNPNNLAQTGLSQAKLKANMAKLAKTDHIFMFIDSCHSGAVDLAKINQDIASFDKIKQQLGENIFILAASGENQEAQDKFRLEDSNTPNNGLFAYAVMEGLKGKARRLDDNVIDNFNLGSYVQRRVDALTKNQTLYKQKARFQIVEVGDILTFDITKYN